MEYYHNIVMNTDKLSSQVYFYGCFSYLLFRGGVSQNRERQGLKLIRKIE